MFVSSARGGTARSRRSFVRAFRVLASLATTASSLAAQNAPLRPTPDTSYGVHVFDDGLAPGLTSAQVDFAARHHAGTQKMTRSEADRYRAVNPDFLVLHYRLGQGLGYRQTSAPCNPNGSWNSVIDGTWVPEWPGDSVVKERWFWHQNGARTLQCQWGWYLMNTDDADWRRWWSNQVLLQLEHNDDDGIFADSFLVPSYMGGFNPPLPSVDPTFEGQWSARMASFMDFMRERFEGRYRFVPNVGTWVTTRDQTDFTHADGVFIEGFGYDVWSQYGEEAFTIQGDRLLRMAAQDKIVIGECWDVDAAWKRMHSLACYLLVKGKRSFIDFENGTTPEWWPEYDVAIGEPLSAPAPSTAALFDPAKGVYTRDFSNGKVFLNAGTTTRSFALGATYHRATANGGGFVPSDGVLPTSWNVTTAPVSALTLAPGEAAVVLVDPTPYELVEDLVFAGQQATLRVRNATPGTPQYFFISRARGSTPMPTLGVTLDLAHPRVGAIRTADAQGNASWTFTLPATTSLATLSFQAAELGNATQAARIHVH